MSSKIKLKQQKGRNPSWSHEKYLSQRLNKFKLQQNFKSHSSHDAIYRQPLNLCSMINMYKIYTYDTQNNI